MSSYVNKKTRVFTSPGSTRVIQKRSESRLKSIKSATDNRAWTDCVEERRQYILELIKTKAGGLSLGKYIPIEVIIDCLLANKNAQIEALQRQLDAYKKLKLTDDQLRQLGMLSPGGDKRTENVSKPPPTVEKVKEVKPQPAPPVQTAPPVPPPPQPAPTPPAPTTPPPPQPTPPPPAPTPPAPTTPTPPAPTPPPPAPTPPAPTTPPPPPPPKPTPPPPAPTPPPTTSTPQKTPPEDVKSEKLVPPVAARAEEKPELPEPSIASKKEVPEPPPVPVEPEEKKKEIEEKIEVEKEEKPEVLGIVSEEAPQLSEKKEKGKEEMPPESGEVPDTEKGLKGEFQRISVGDTDKGPEPSTTAKDETKDEDRKSRDESLKKSFIEIAETVDEGMEKGAIEASSEKKEHVAGKEDTIQSLQRKLEEQRRANKLAERAVNQLESIGKILSAGDKLRCNLTCRNVCQPCPTLTKKMNDIDNMKQRLEGLMKERDELRLQVSELEKRLAGQTDPSDEVGRSKERSGEELDAVVLDELAERLDRVIGLDTKAQELINQLNAEEQTGQTQNSKTIEKLEAKIAELEKELEKIRPLKVENAKLKMKVQELSHMEKTQDELRNKIGSMEGEYKAKYDDLCRMENECNALRNQLANTKLLQKERDMLRRQVGDLECCVADLEDEIKRLVGHIDRLTEGRDEQQTKMQTAISDIRVELEKKTLLIEKSEEKLATVQDELEKSIRGVNSETLCYKMKIEDLEKILKIKDDEVKLLKESLEEKNNAINNLQQIKKANEDLLHSEQSKLNSLKDKLDNSIKQNEKLQKELEKLVTFKNNENSVKKILLHSRSAIKKVREEINMQYQEWEKGSGEDYQRVEELESIIKSLETEKLHMKQMNDELQTALKNQKKCNCLVGLENNTLKKHSTEIQNIAKHQVGDLLEHLKGSQLRIIELEEMLDQTKTTKMKLETKDSENSCDCDKEAIERLMKENEMLKQLIQKEPTNERMEEEFKDQDKVNFNTDQDLLNEIKRLKNEILSLESDKLKLEKENENLRTKTLDRRTVDVQSLSDQLDSTNEERIEKLLTIQREEIEKLKKEIEKLKEALEESRKNLSLSNKQVQSSNTNIQNLEDSLKLQKDATSKMHLMNEDLRERHKILSEEIKQIRSENEDLRNKLKEMEQLKKQLDECLEKKNNENIQILSSQGKLEKENQNLKDDVTEKENLRKKLAECLEKERNINNEKSASEEALKKEIERLKNQLTELQKDKTTAAPDESMKRENENLKNELKEMEDIKKQLTDCLNKEKEQKSSLEDKLTKELQKDKAPDESMKRENENLKNKLKEMEDIKKQLTDCLNKEKEQKSSLADGLKKENEDLKKALNEMEKVKKNLAECLEREKKNNNSSLKDENDGLKAQLADVKKKLAACIEQGKKDSETIKRLELASSNTKDSNIFETKIENLQKQLEECLAREKETKKVIEKESFQSAMQTKPEDVEKMEKDLADSKKNLIDAEKKLKSTENELEMMRKELDKCRKENDKLKKDNDENKKKVIEERKTKETSKIDKPGMSEELEKLRKENKKLREENDQLLKKLQSAKSTNEPETRGSEKKKEDEPILSSAGSEGAIVPEDASREELLAEIDRLQKKLQQQREDCEKTIRMIKDQCDREVKNVQSENLKSIEKLQEKHSQDKQDLEMKHDSVIRSLQDELRMSMMSEEIPTRDTAIGAKTKKDKALSTQTFCVCSEMPKVVPIITTLGADIAVHEVDSANDKSGNWPKPKKSLLNQILYKAINLGLEKLTPDEIQMIISKLTEVKGKAKNAIPRSSNKPPTDNPASLMNRIVELEDNLEKKQKSAKQKVVSLHLLIRSMEQKILETRNIVEREKEHNAELKARLMMMERDSQLMQVDRDIMKQQTNFQEQQIAKLKKTCDCKKNRKKEIEGEQKKKKHFKRSRRDSFSSDSSEILSQRIQSAKRRSTPTPVSGVRSPHHIPPVNIIIPSDDVGLRKREKHGACPCCSTRESDKKK